MKTNELELKINIPEIGKIIGTVDWVIEKLEKVNNSLEVSEYTDIPCLLFADQRNMGKKTIICMPHSGTYDKESDADYRLIESSEQSVLVINSVGGMFVYLTPKAKKLADEYIENVAFEFMKSLVQQ